MKFRPPGTVTTWEAASQAAEGAPQLLVSGSQDKNDPGRVPFP